MKEPTTMKGVPFSETHEKTADGLYLVLKEKYAVPYRRALEAQTKSWLEGKPVHNHFSDECCPDFSCCHPEMLWPVDRRMAFAAGSQEVREQMMLGALNGVANLSSAYIAGQVNENKTVH